MKPAYKVMGKQITNISGWVGSMDKTVGEVYTYFKENSEYVKIFIEDDSGWAYDYAWVKKGWVDDDGKFFEKEIEC